MTEQTRISRSGQVVVPRDVVAGQGWTADTELELVSSPEGVLIRPKAAPADGEERKPAPMREISYEEFRRRLPKQDGRPPLTDAQIRLILEQEAERRHLADMARAAGEAPPAPVLVIP